MYAHIYMCAGYAYDGSNCLYIPVVYSSVFSSSKAIMSFFRVTLFLCSSLEYFTIFSHHFGQPSRRVSGFPWVPVIALNSLRSYMLLREIIKTCIITRKQCQPMAIPSKHCALCLKIIKPCISYCNIPCHGLSEEETCRAPLKQEARGSGSNLFVLHK